MDLLARSAIAAVWLHQGLWCKVLGRAGHQRDLLAGVPLLGGTRALAAVRVIGAAEVGLALWVLSGRRPVAAAAAQTALLLGMNAGGLRWGRSRIADPTGMVLQNAALAALAWRVAR